MGFFLRVSPVQTCIMRIGKEICRKLLTERGDDREREETVVIVHCWFGIVGWVKKVDSPSMCLYLHCILRFGQRIVDRVGRGGRERVIGRRRQWQWRPTCRALSHTLHITHCTLLIHHYTLHFPYSSLQNVLVPLCTLYLTDLHTMPAHKLTLQLIIQPPTPLAHKAAHYTWQLIMTKV